MTAVDRALADAGRLRAIFVGESGYAVAYGSHASRQTVGDSDLDLLFIGAPLRPGQLDQLVRAVVALHHDHRLRLDTEVGYEVKLHATVAEVDTALMLRGFTIEPTGELHVPPVVVADWFLNSKPFKRRLILNALTTPHVFLGGDIDQYRWQCARADRAVALVALSLLDGAAVVTVPEAVTALVDGPNGATGEDFLGYSHGPALHSTIQRGLAQLIAEQVVRTVDGARFEQRRNVRCSLIAAFNGP